MWVRKLVVSHILLSSFGANLILHILKPLIIHGECWNHQVIQYHVFYCNEYFIKSITLFHRYKWYMFKKIKNACPNCFGWCNILTLNCMFRTLLSPTLQSFRNVLFVKGVQCINCKQNLQFGNHLCLLCFKLKSYIISAKYPGIFQYLLNSVQMLVLIITE